MTRTLMTRHAAFGSKESEMLSDDLDLNGRVFGQFGQFGSEVLHLSLAQNYMPQKKKIA